MTGGRSGAFVSANRDARHLREWHSKCLIKKMSGGRGGSVLCVRTHVEEAYAHDFFPSATFVETLIVSYVVQT